MKYSPTFYFQSQFFIGITCFTFGTAFVQALCAEIPFVRLEKILLGGQLNPDDHFDTNSKAKLVHFRTNQTQTKRRKEQLGQGK